MNNFTPRARQVLALSCKEANGLANSYVGSEHLLLGLIRLGQGVSFDILRNHGLSLATVRPKINKDAVGGSFTEMPKKIRYTAGAKQALALAGKEAKGLSHSVVGTEHILLGLLRGSGAASNLLKSCGIDIEKARIETYEALKGNPIMTHRTPSFTPCLLRQVSSNQRLPILIMSSVATCLLLLTAYFQLISRN